VHVLSRVEGSPQKSILLTNQNSRAEQGDSDAQLRNEPFRSGHTALNSCSYGTARVTVGAGSAPPCPGIVFVSGQGQ